MTRTLELVVARINTCAGQLAKSKCLFQIGKGENLDHFMGFIDYVSLKVLLFLPYLLYMFALSGIVFTF